MHRCCEGCVASWLHNYASVTVVSSSLWCQKGCRFVIEDFNCFIGAFLFRLSFYIEGFYDSELGCGNIGRIRLSQHCDCLSAQFGVKLV